MEFIDPTVPLNSNSTHTISHGITNALSQLPARWSIIAFIVALIIYCLPREITIKSPAKRNHVTKAVRFKGEIPGTRSELVKAQLEGTWHLVSYHLELNTPIRVTSYPFGKEPIGRLIYTSDGYMSMNIMHPGCEPFKATNPHGGTTEENSSAAAHYMAYSGRYETYEHDGEKLVNHILDSSLYPNWLNADQVRACEIDGNELVLRPTNMPTFLGMQVCGILRWKRAASLE